MHRRGHIFEDDHSSLSFMVWDKDKSIPVQQLSKYTSLKVLSMYGCNYKNQVIDDIDFSKLTKLSGKIC